MRNDRRRKTATRQHDSEQAEDEQAEIGFTALSGSLKPKEHELFVVKRDGQEWTGK